MTTSQKLTIQNPGGLAELLPFLLGLYPDDSIVLHSVTGPNIVDGPTMTAPIPDDPATWQETAETFACHFLNTVQDRGIRPEKVIIYLCREPRPGQAAEDTAEELRSLANWITDTCIGHGVPVLESLGITAGRWWAYQCITPGCCFGVPLPPLDAPHSVTAELIRKGYSPGRRSSEIAAEFHPLETNAAPLQWQAFEDEGVSLQAQNTTPTGKRTAHEFTGRLLATAMQDFREGATELADDITARLILGLQDSHARDQAVEYCEDDDLPHARRLWAYLARRCVSPHTDKAVPLLTLLAWVAWRQNDTVTARVALRHALTTNPRYTLAGLLHDGINGGAGPLGLLAIARDQRAERLSEAHREQRTDSH
ncbi:DUF4192 domain-containing protein [Streptomyces sp. NPDC004647]|uniref:DUF4192 domain-containing protein n=1 Tax=Streptomyces sp. NPDC004647 TaxID=3154671 RepID=UPI0033A8641A